MGTGQELDFVLADALLNQLAGENPLCMTPTRDAPARLPISSSDMSSVGCPASQKTDSKFGLTTTQSGSHQPWSSLVQ